MVEGKPFNTEHKLNENKHIEPVKKKKRGLALERNEATCKEVEELLKPDILREVKYQTWVVNLIMEKKVMEDGECYHQIQMAEGDEDKTDSFTESIQQSKVDRMQGVLCYRKMPFGLKNAGATYQSLIDKAFSNQIRRNLEAYVDDLETVQWTADAEEAFRKMKELIEIFPTLTAPIKGKALIIYLTASTKNISIVLLAEREKRQVPIYFISRVLQVAELNYPELEKLIPALVYAARRLRRYFQAYPIRVLTDKPIKQILARPEKSGRISKWAIKLGEHDIKFIGHNSVKGQLLVDFLAETPST
ncbi:reverse transcriptase domain-containing protein [Tanacetum coccineum]